MSSDHIEFARHLQDTFGCQIIPLHGIRASPGTVSPFECRCISGGGCENPGKHPKSRWKDQQSQLPGEYDNYGFVSNTIVVVDFDSHDPVGEPWNSLPVTNPTFTVETRKGKHLFYKSETALATRINIVPGVDLKASGGLVVGPYSRRIDGGVYEPTPESESLPMAQFPMNLRSVARPASSGTYKMVDDKSILDTTPQWARPTANQAIETMITSEFSGARNNTLFRLACDMFKDKHMGRDVIAELREAAYHAGLSPQEIERTVVSAYAASVNG